MKSYINLILYLLESCVTCHCCIYSGVHFSPLKEKDLPVVDAAICLILSMFLAILKSQDFGKHAFKY